MREGRARGDRAGEKTEPEKTEPEKTEPEREDRVREGRANGSLLIVDTSTISPWPNIAW
jgi:hypothetical protein